MANKGTNNTNKKTSNSKSSNRKTTSKSTSKTSTQKKNSSKQSHDEHDPFFEDSTKEIILWASLGVCILMLISNFGLGGNIGNAIAGFFFGTFGIIQFILPVFIAFSAFFLISNYGNKVAVAKIIAACVLLIALGGFIELFTNGSQLMSAIDCFYAARETKKGGGYVSGGLVHLLYTSFGLFGAYLIDIITLVVSIIIIIERFAFDKVQNSSRYHSDRAAARRRERRELQQIEREANQTRFNNERTAIRNKLESDYQKQLEEEQAEGPRRNRKHSGVTMNTTLLSKEVGVSDDADDVNEIRFNMGASNENIEVTQTKRHKLISGKSSKSSHSFDDKFDALMAGADETQITTSNLVINMPKETESTTVSANELMNSHLQYANSVPETTHRAKASVTDEKEMEATADTMTKAIASDSAKPKKPYKFPPLSLLNSPKAGSGDSKDFLNEMAEKLQRTLKNFGVDAKVVEATLGPSVTQYKIQIDQGTKVSKVLNLSDDIKLNMAVTDVRIEAPIPGEPYIGIEVPNRTKTMVGFKDLASSSEFKTSKSKISFCVGKDISGKVIVGNIEKMPHLLIAGATGSGKSVCINTIIMSIIYHASPDDVKLIMVDPKMVELSVYNGIPHLLIPVVTDAKKAAGALHWAVKEMTDRYELLAMAGVRNIESYNEKVQQDALPDNIPEDRRGRMPQIVVILDELADLMMVAAADVEDSIVRLAQLARAAGIHLIIATQRPTSNVITGLIKANVPSRIAFSVATGIDSRVILDMNGAEDLLGNGDMLYAPQNLSKPIRIQGAFVSEEEVARVVDYLKNNNDNASYNSEIEEVIQKSESSNGNVAITTDFDNSKDNLFAEAGRLVIENQKGSIGYLQRNFRIGFNRAARIMDQLSEAGVVGPEVGTKPREIRMSISEFEEFLNQQ